MPIYEFYCEACNTIFSFLSRRVNTAAQPDCPRCKTERLKRQPSLFAVVNKTADTGEGEADLPFDESRMENVLEGLAKEAANLNEDDPRQMAQLMRKFSEGTGLQLGSAMEEALARMEAGEDPEQIEQEMGDLLEGEEPFAMEQKKSRSSRSKPQRDETLYEL